MAVNWGDEMVGQMAVCCVERMVVTRISCMDVKIAVKVAGYMAMDCFN